MQGRLRDLPGPPLQHVRPEGATLTSYRRMRDTGDVWWWVAAMATTALGAVVVIVVAARQQRRSDRGARRRAEEESSLGFAAADLQELQQRLADAAQQVIDSGAGGLHRRLTSLRARRTPLRRVSPAPHEPETARLHFADGSTVIVRGRHPGDLVVLAYRAQRVSMTITEVERSPEGLRVHLYGRGPTEARAVVLALGLDQAD